MEHKTEIATFAAGCFWGVEATFRKVPGVVDVNVGYTGGTTDNPTYAAVSSGKTGHAEAVQVKFDPKRVSYAELLNIFWNSHDPTTVDRQGPNIGSQYRSAIFYHDEGQKRVSKRAKDALSVSRRYTKPIVTEVSPAMVFYRSEEYHQRYFEKQWAYKKH
jgi:peptide-methionine (S)-S-oxide reductase